MSKNNRIIPIVGNRHLVLIIAVFVVIGVGVARSKVFQSDETPSTNHATFVVKRGPLRISVIESGTIKARDQVIIKSEVEGQTSILSLVAEGTRVKKGDLLVELDASKLLDEKIDQQIKVQNADAAFVGARENLAVVENQAQSDVDKAQLASDFAKEDLKKYQEGEYPNQLKEAESRLTLASEELARAEEKLQWSRKLFDEKYISQTELQADELTVKRNSLDLELAKNNLDLLKNFTHKRNLAQLESDVKQAEMALERTKRKASADVVQAGANLEAKKAEFERQKDKLEKIEKQIEKTKIYAPTDGLVIYATSAQSGGFRRGSNQPLQEGQEVRERQELIYLPTTASSMVEVALHEASLDKVHVGLPVKVTVDALPGETFYGRIANIAPLPDPQSAWMNPDLKVYNTDINLDNSSTALRTGMSCKAEIIIEQHQEATYIPVQSVLRVGGEPTVYIIEGDTLKPRKVEIGFDNDRMVRIISGLEPGEVVSLTPPLEAAATAPATEEIIDEIGPVQKPAPAPSVPVAKQTSTPPGVAPEQPERGGPPPSGGGNQGRPGNLGRLGNQGPPGNQGNLSPEQRERSRQFFQNLSSEEREKLRNMSPEERRQFREQMMNRQSSSGVN
jgi:HlyD family secretion protein